MSTPREPLQRLSFSGPVFSVEDEKRESTELSDHQKLEIYSDMFGSGDIHDESEDNEALETMALFRLVDALEAIPTNRKPAYFEAIRDHPKLVKRETSSLHFLRRDGFDEDASAARIVEYWEIRRKLFHDRAFAPMSLTEGGALNEDDIRLLYHGPFQFLPEDSQGRAILFFNKENYDPTLHAKDSMLRCMFYMMSIAAEHESIRKNGLVWLGNYKYFDGTHHSRRDCRLMMKLLNDCMPVKVVALHVCYGSTKSAFELALPTFKHFMGPCLRHRLQLHIGDNEVILEGLKKYGINHVPTALGGEIPFDESWFEEQRSGNMEEKVGSVAASKTFTARWNTKFSRAA